MNTIGSDLLRSSVLIDGANSLSDFHAWFDNRLKMGQFEVEICSLDNMQGWILTREHLDMKAGNFLRSAVCMWSAKRMIV